MSVSTIIKNTILIVLIILIGHFMIQNVLVEKKPQLQQSTPLLDDKASKHQMAKLKISDHKDGKDSEAKVNQPAISTERPVGIPSSQTVSCVNGGLDKAKQELLKFVDDEEDAMDSFFTKQTPTLKIEAVPSDNCKLKTQDAMLPLATTCDPLISMLHSKGKIGDADKSGNSSFTYDKKGLMILQEYDNENTMNGGSLYGGLSAFDSFNDNFQPVSL